MKGYAAQLYVLPFDHRSSFAKTLLELGYPTKPADKNEVARYKKIVYDAFQVAQKRHRHCECLGLLVDEEFGSEILKKAKKAEQNFAVSTEKSGQQVYRFEFGTHFKKHIEKYDPIFAKALIRYNPANKKDNETQNKRLKQLNDYLDKAGVKFMLEPLIIPTEAELKKAKGNKRIFDKTKRPALMIKTIKELHAAGVEPDVWKIEAMDKRSDWNKVIKAIRDTRQRRHVGIIVLGRGEDKKVVDGWLKLAAKTGKINGFAVGRTVFFKPLADYRDGKIKRQQAVDRIANNYTRLIKNWEKNRK